VSLCEWPKSIQQNNRASTGRQICNEAGDHNKTPFTANVLGWQGSTLEFIYRVETYNRERLPLRDATPTAVLGSLTLEGRLWKIRLRVLFPCSSPGDYILSMCWRPVYEGTRPMHLRVADKELFHWKAFISARCRWRMSKQTPPPARTRQEGCHQSLSESGPTADGAAAPAGAPARQELESSLLLDISGKNVPVLLARQPQSCGRIIRLADALRSHLTRRREWAAALSLLEKAR
jgi:hypothetical protein